jgi:hypothetical protein
MENIPFRAKSLIHEIQGWESVSIGSTGNFGRIRDLIWEELYQSLSAVFPLTV